MSRKRPVPPSMDQQNTAPTALHAEPQPLFLPDLDGEQGPSISIGTPLFLPEEGEEERPKRKKRRISTKVTQFKTLNDLWHSRQVSEASCLLIFYGDVLTPL